MRRNLNKVQFALVRNRRVSLVAALFINVNVVGFLDVAVADVSEPCFDERGSLVNPKCTDSDRANAYIKHGTESANKRDYDQAIQDFTNAIRYSDRNAITYYHRANAYTNIHDYNDALKDYTKAAELEPTFAETFNNRCYVYNVMGNYRFAIEDCTRAIQLDPKQANFFIGRANAYFKLGDFEQALSDYTKSIEVDPTDGNAFLGRARAYMNKSDYGHALKDLDKTIDLVPTNANAWNNRCWVHAFNGQLKVALDDCKEAVRLRPKDPHSLDSLALTYFLMSRLEKEKSKKDKELNAAIKNYTEALLYSPNLASSLYGRGLAKLEKGDTEGGNADVSAAKEIDTKIEDEFKKDLQRPLEDSAN
jgi:tetratricopeptide (TPR) repeat protein